MCRSERINRFSSINQNSAISSLFMMKIGHLGFGFNLVLLITNRMLDLISDPGGKCSMKRELLLVM